MMELRLKFTLGFVHSSATHYTPNGPRICEVKPNSRYWDGGLNWPRDSGRCPVFS